MDHRRLRAAAEEGAEDRDPRLPVLLRLLLRGVLPLPHLRRPDLEFRGQTPDRSGEIS
jgi:hypothetical protein